MQRAVTIVTTLMICALTLPAIAQEPPTAPGADRAEEAVARFLELTPDQVEAWELLAEQRRLDAEPIRDSLEDVHAELGDLLGQEEPDAMRVGELVIQRRRLGEALHDIQIAYVEGFEALLDGDQLGRLELIRRADRLQPLSPAFERTGLLPRR